MIPREDARDANDSLAETCHAETPRVAAIGDRRPLPVAERQEVPSDEVSPPQTPLIVPVVPVAPAALVPPPSDPTPVAPASVLATGALPAEPIPQNLGGYRVLRLIGRGSMGQVFAAEHTLIGRVAAIKLLNANWCNRPEIVHRFLNEARAVNQARHENIVEVTDFGVAGSDRIFIVMELLEGIGLADLMRCQGALPEARAAHIGLQIASALVAAHRAGVIHRDLKPDNVMLVRRRADPDFVKLLDFGVAKLGDAAGGAGGAETRLGELLGTPRYMSPEQAQGRPVDHRTDLYSLGILLYEMTTGRVPFRGPVDEVLRRQVSDPPVPPREIVPVLSLDMEEIIVQCLQKDPERRPRAAEEVESALVALASVSRPRVGLRARPPVPGSAEAPPPGPPSPPLGLVPPPPVEEQSPSSASAVRVASAAGRVLALAARARTAVSSPAVMVAVLALLAVAGFVAAAVITRAGTAQAGAAPVGAGDGDGHSPAAASPAGVGSGTEVAVAVAPVADAVSPRPVPPDVPAADPAGAATAAPVTGTGSPASCAPAASGVGALTQRATY